jgi:hypothetical protein
MFVAQTQLYFLDKTQNQRMVCLFILFILFICFVHRGHCTCFAIPGTIDLPVDSLSIASCLPLLLDNDTSVSFVTFANTGEFTNAEASVLRGRLFFQERYLNNPDPCNGVEFARLGSGATQTISFHVVVCRNGEINNVLRHTMRDMPSCNMTTRICQQETSIAPVSNNTLVLSTMQHKHTMLTSELTGEDFAKVTLRSGGLSVVATQVVEKFDNIGQDVISFQLVDWNSQAAVVSSAPKSGSPLFMSCRAARYSGDVGRQPRLSFDSQTDNFAPNVEIDVASQWLLLSVDTATDSTVRRVMLNQETSIRISDLNLTLSRNRVWPTIIGVQNRLGLDSAGDGNPAQTAFRVFVADDDSAIVVTRHSALRPATSSFVQVEVIVAIVVFRDDANNAPTSAPSRSPTTRTSDNRLIGTMPPKTSASAATTTTTTTTTTSTGAQPTTSAMQTPTPTSDDNEPTTTKTTTTTISSSSSAITTTSMVGSTVSDGSPASTSLPSSTSITSVLSSIFDSQSESESSSISNQFATTSVIAASEQEFLSPTAIYGIAGGLSGLVCILLIVIVAILLFLRHRRNKLVREEGGEPDGSTLTAAQLHLEKLQFCHLFVDRADSSDWCGRCAWKTCF